MRPYRRFRSILSPNLRKYNVAALRAFDQPPSNANGPLHWYEPAGSAASYTFFVRFSWSRNNRLLALSTVQLMKLQIQIKIPKNFAFAGLLAASISTAVFAIPALAADNEQPDHIFFIMMENHPTNHIIGNTADAPFINQLAQRYSVATNYHGVTHPSLPNYLSAISGDFQGIWDDCKAGMTVTCAPEEFVVGAGDATDPTSSVYTDPKSPLFGAKPPQLNPAEVASSSSTSHWFGGV